MMIMNENIGSREGALQDYVDRFPPKTLDRIAALGSGYPQDQDKELLCAAFVELSRTLRCRHAALESARNGNFTETRALLDSWADEDAPSCEPAAVPNMQALGRHRTSANNVVQIYHEFRLDFSEESRRWEEKAAYLDANFGHISKDIIAKHNDPGWIPGPWDIIYETSEEEIRAAFTEYADGTYMRAPWLVPPSGVRPGLLKPTQVASTVSAALSLAAATTTRCRRPQRDTRRLSAPLI